MTPGTTVYLLERNGEVLGRMPLQSVEMFAIHCGFEPTPAFEPYRALFDEDAALADRMNDDDSSELMAQAEAVLDRILALNLLIRRVGGGVHRGAMISVEGDHASFRPLDLQEESL
ncbi:hypothetical protein FHR04_00045 [Deinococcus radiopugnans ATCC 19172]|uniref:Uncharacterized protein n=1 Tax=Deinococcus radiopugnans ATCC 19172 TaxID=585398 RepID=A0A5C4YCK1_9DEIO|nr:hypothetical protein FHR04_00045 [Deinococcus radiopugnans ATCC 19172]